MPVIAIYTYEVRTGRLADFLAKLKEAASPKFNSAGMPTSVRVFQSTVPGPDTGSLILFIEYENMAAYGARAAFEFENDEWRQLFAAHPDSPERLLSVHLLTEVKP